MASTINRDAGDGQRPPEGAVPPESVRERASQERYARGFKDQQWRDEFPYQWREDDLVTRRDTLRFLVSGTGALFLATGALALAGSIRRSTTLRFVAVARVGELAENESKVFNYPDNYSQGILINLPGRGLVAYSDVCTHLSCAVLWQPKENHLYCPCHDGLFDVTNGEVLAGPPTRPLPLIQLETHNGVVYAVKEVER